ncbi:MAG: phage tail protein [Lunatimonas sp.]|uniref:phage tail protein n=1 Tax=Lunatimonas sp. TaxID=2060141 RepID=UPI00263A7F4D|nr:phage tail protein [Lunatimonas sp.]MCC5938897.1 phage tail protein [Lunatimonas sp.]
MTNNYPPVGFHFSVEFTGMDGETADSQFQSVSGLSVSIDTEEIAEGGENRFKYKLPVRTKHANLVLKRGLRVNSKLIDWCMDSFENFEFELRDLTIKLLNEEHEPLMTWNVVHAFPIKWEVDEFNAQESKLVVETIELAYQYCKTLS